MKYRNFAFFGAFMFILVLVVTGFAFSPVSPPEGGGSVYLPLVITPVTLSNARRVNVPYDTNTSLPRRTIFWFGEVDPTSNYADVRAIYDDDSLYLKVQIFDRRLWLDESPTQQTLTEWDSVSLYLDTNGNSGVVPDADSYQFVAQLNNPPQARENYQAAYRGNGSGWSSSNIIFDSLAGWQGTGLNDNNGDDRGWGVELEIPFASLGYPSRPSDGSVWGMAVVVHDRDSASGGSIPDQIWPEGIVETQPNSWGQIHFGEPAYVPPTAVQGSTTIQHGLNGANIVDAHVGGGFDCGQAYNPNFFNGWGDANYFNSNNEDQMNVQNQANLGDWPCFSKIYITFPLNQVPAGKQIVSAELTLNHFGNSNPAEAHDSLIHVLTAGESWSEQTITWNNAPLAVENISVTRVEPLPSFPGWPGIPNQWDVSRATAGAYAAGEPLRLVFYSTDSALHSGKYFYSSDADPEGRPKLLVEWGN